MWMMSDINDLSFSAPIMFSDAINIIIVFFNDLLKGQDVSKP